MALAAVSCTSPSTDGGVSQSLPEGEACWVAMGMDETWTSTDGLTWSSARSPRADWGYSTIRDMATDGSNVVSLGADVYWSSDGRTWRTVGLVEPPGSSEALPTNLYAVGWNGSSWMVLADRFAAASTDGLTWTATPSPAVSFAAIAGDKSMWVVVGQWADARSLAGRSWEVADVPHSAPEQSQMDDVIRRDNDWLAVGTDRTGLEGLIRSSTDGLTWTTIARTQRRHFPESVAASGDTVVVVGADVLSGPEGYGGAGLVWVSHGGGPFNEIEPGVAQLRDVATDGRRWVAVGANAIIVSSDDGASWTVAKKVSDVLGGVVYRCAA